MANLSSRKPASLEICTLLRKPEVAKVKIDVKYVGFDIPNEFVVGYGWTSPRITATCAASAPCSFPSTVDHATVIA